MTNDRVTRRDLIRRVGQIAGAGGALTALQTLGFIPEVDAFQGPPGAPAQLGHGKSVVVLGAGIAGLVAAYELKQSGFQVKIIEARERPGGRVWTIRGGDVVDHDHHGPQTCTFEPGQFFNGGAARIPSTHEGVHHYCRELGVELETQINDNRSALFVSERVNGGVPIENRQLVNDSRGAISELLAKAINKNALDDDLNTTDKEKLLQFLKPYGALNDQFMYSGSSRSGYTIPPSLLGAPEVHRRPVPLSELTEDPGWAFLMMFGESLDQQSTMTHPKGGIDHIPYAFSRKLEGDLEYEAVVTKLGRKGAGVEIVYTDKTGTAKAIEADYCVCTLPCSVFETIEADLSPIIMEGIYSFGYQTSCKVAWEAPRFWERENGIFGGISWNSSSETNICWYPSYGFHSERGVVVGCYNFGGTALAFGTRPYAEQFAASRASIEQVHPGRGHLFEKPVAVNWLHVPHSKGAWSQQGEDVYHDPACVRALFAGDGPIFFAGQHLSPIGAWMEAAIRTAHVAVGHIYDRTKVQL
ncbi:MAG: flavin monoamine oxidase family protein [Alphaproteobacteria bacterium]